MANRLVLAVVGAFSISLLVVGGGGAAVCDPHCAPSKSNTASQANKGPEVRGTDHAIDVANERAVNTVDKGLNKARQQPGNYKTPAPVESGGGDTGGGSTGGGDTGGGGPCTGC